MFTTLQRGEYPNNAHYVKQWGEGVFKLNHYVKQWGEGVFKLNHYVKQWCGGTVYLDDSRRGAGFRASCPEAPELVVRTDPHCATTNVRIDHEFDLIGSLERRGVSVGWAIYK